MDTSSHSQRGGSGSSSGSGNANGNRNRDLQQPGSASGGTAAASGTANRGLNSSLPSRNSVLPTESSGVSDLELSLVLANPEYLDLIVEGGGLGDLAEGGGMGIPR